MLIRASTPNQKGMTVNENILDLGVRTIGDPNHPLTSAEQELISAFLNMAKEAQEQYLSELKAG